MRRTRIKICGVRRVEDALLAAQAGADAIGMVFHEPADRNCPLDVAEAIVRALPSFVTPVALFMDATLARVREVCQSIGVSTMQLHGEETPEFVAALAPLGVIKTLRLARGEPGRELLPWRTSAPSNLRGLLLETPGSAGGSGEENDWELIRQAQEQGLLEGLPPLIVAGGLRPDNVGAVVQLIRPWAVDVSSGVEEIKGQKSQQRVEAFIRGVREADAALAGA